MARSALRRKTVLSSATVLIAAVLPALSLVGVAAARPGSGGGSSHSWNFERDAVGAVPAGCTTPTGKAPVTVTDQTAHRSRHSLELNDDSATAQPVITCARPAQSGGQLTFWADPQALPNGYLSI